MAFEDPGDIEAFFADGDAARYTSAAGNVSTIFGIFEERYLDVTLGGERAEGRQVTFRFPSHKAPDCAQGRQFVIAGVTYSVKSARPLGDGTTLAVLEI